MGNGQGHEKDKAKGNDKSGEMKIPAAAYKPHPDPKVLASEEEWRSAYLQDDKLLDIHVLEEMRREVLHGRNTDGDGFGTYLQHVRDTLGERIKDALQAPVKGPKLGEGDRLPIPYKDFTRFFQVPYRLPDGVDREIDCTARFHPNVEVSVKKDGYLSDEYIIAVDGKVVVHCAEFYGQTSLNLRLPMQPTAIRVKTVPIIPKVKHMVKDHIFIRQGFDFPD